MAFEAAQLSAENITLERAPFSSGLIATPFVLATKRIGALRRNDALMVLRAQRRMSEAEPGRTGAVKIRGEGVLRRATPKDVRGRINRLHEAGEGFGGGRARSPASSATWGMAGSKLYGSEALKAAWPSN